MLIIFIIFVGYPIILTFYGSIIDINDVFVGFKNITTIFKDNIFFKSIINTAIILVFYLAIKIPLVVFLASILNGINKTKKILMTIFFIPTIVGVFAYGIIFRFLFSNDGLFNSFLDFFGVNLNFLDNGVLAKFVVAIALVISTFGTMVLYLLISMNNNISNEIYDSVEVDGAGFLNKIRFITLPLLWPIIRLFILFGTIECISLIDIPYQLTAGGPNNNTLTIGYYIYKQAISYGNFSYASMISVLTLIMVLLLIFLPNSVRRGYEGGNY